MTRIHLKLITLFDHHPLRLGLLPHAPRQGCQSIGPPPVIVTIGSIPAILILASDTLTLSLATGSGCQPRSRVQAGGIDRAGIQFPKSAP